MTMFVGGPFAVIAGGRVIDPAAVQLFTAATVLIVSVISARERQLLQLGTAVVAETLIVTGRPSPHRFISEIRPTGQPLLIPAALARSLAAALRSHVESQQTGPHWYRHHRRDRPLLRAGAYALATVVLVTLAAAWPTGPTPDDPLRRPFSLPRGRLLRVASGSGKLQPNVVSTLRWNLHPITPGTDSWGVEYSQRRRVSNPTGSRVPPMRRHNNGGGQ